VGNRWSRRDYSSDARTKWEPHPVTAFTIAPPSACPASEAHNSGATPQSSRIGLEFGDLTHFDIGTFHGDSQYPRSDPDAGRVAQGHHPIKRANGRQTQVP
jgi:hypothetical protein